LTSAFAKGPEGDGWDSRTQASNRHSGSVRRPRIVHRGACSNMLMADLGV
jgi:hypothetical protein